MGAKVMMLVGYKNVEESALSARYLMSLHTRTFMKSHIRQISFESTMVTENEKEEPIPWPKNEDTWDKMVFDLLSNTKSTRGCFSVLII